MLTIHKMIKCATFDNIEHYNNVALADFGCWSKLQPDAKSDNGTKQEF